MPPTVMDRRRYLKLCLPTTVGAFPPKISLVSNLQVSSWIGLGPPGWPRAPRHGPGGVREQARRPARVVWRAGGPVAASIRLSEPHWAARVMHTIKCHDTVLYNCTIVINYDFL